jgi:putative tryptophan/tyrosine transport system substrate-binding protein
VSLSRRSRDTTQSRGRLDGYRLPCSVALVVLLLSSGLLRGATEAAERAHPILIGALSESWGPTPQEVGLRDGLQELGYREHEQFVIGSRFTQGDPAALPAAARELVQYGAHLIFVTGENPAKAAQQTTTQLPIVFAGQVHDPVGLGLIASFARPGRNITGVTDLYLELGSKRLEVFWELIPGLKHVLFPYDATNAQAVVAAKVYRDAARRLGIELVERAVRNQEEAQKTLAHIQQGEVEGLLAPWCCAANLPGLVLEATAQQGLPTMFDTAFWVERGGLASYGSDYYALGRQAARLVDKILKGAHPAEIPVEVHSKIEFVINLKTAQALGLTIAPEMLFRADRLVR